MARKGGRWYDGWGEEWDNENGRERMRGRGKGSRRRSEGFSSIHHRHHRHHSRHRLHSRRLHSRRHDRRNDASPRARTCAPPCEWEWAVGCYLGRENVSNHRNHLQRQRSWASTHGSGRINFLGRLRRARASSAISRFDLPPSTVGAEKMRAMQTTVSQRKTRRRLMVGSYLVVKVRRSRKIHTIRTGTQLNT